MKPIKNVFPACEGSEKGYSQSRRESRGFNVGWTKTRQRQDSSYVHHFKPFRLRSKDTLFFWRLQH